MKAIRVEAANQPGKIVQMNFSDLTPGEVQIECHYSSLNYKDALAVTGQGRILKKFPLNPGIDAAGVVKESSSSNIEIGQKVLVTGCGTGEDFDGGYGSKLNVSAAAVIPLPNGMDLKKAMFFGTAAFTAALAVHRLLQNDQTPEKGPILVTGATGGVGNFAISILSHLGFEVIAMTGKKDQHHQLLTSLGASQVCSLEELQLGSRPLEKSLFGGAIDNIGGSTLSQILAHIKLWGNVASIGLAAGHEFNSTVMPFILRGVSLLGVSSNNCPTPLRHDIWKKLSSDWNTKKFSHIPTSEISLEEVLSCSKEMLHRKTIGRTIVKL